MTYVPDSSLSGQTVSLLVAGSQLSVTGLGHGPAPGSTTTTVPTGPTTTTTTTIPADVYTNTQPEPWNPYPCTLGQSTQASPNPTTTTVKGEKGKAGRTRRGARPRQQAHRGRPGGPAPACRSGVGTCRPEGEAGLLWASLGYWVTDRRCWSPTSR